MPDHHNDMEALKAEKDLLTFRVEAAEHRAAWHFIGHLDKLRCS
jgi:hypothetical protein